MDHSSEEWWIINRAKEGQTRMTCPWCSPHRKKKTETCLSVNRDGGTIKYQCYHGDCGVSGRIDTDKKERVQLRVVEKKRREDFDGIDDRHLEWLSARGISAATAQAYDLIGEEIYGRPVIGFPYYDKDGNVVAVKKRFLDEKKFLCWQSPSSFFGLRHIKKGDDIYIAEGESEVLALAEVGIRAVSVPNGATLKITDGKIDPAEDTKFSFLWAAKEYIDAAKRIIIATDADAPGEALAEEIARRVGKERCWRVKFPDGVKDSNEYLLKFGSEKLRKLVAEAEAWPIEGVCDAEHFRDQVWDIYEKGVGKGTSTGYDSVDELFTVVPGQVTIVTGIPSAGKSSFLNQMFVNMAEKSHWKFGLCSFENEPRLHIAQLAAIRAGKPFFEGKYQRMSKHEYEAAFSFIQDHFIFLWQEGSGLTSVDSILDRLRAAVMRYGIRGACIDPANFVSRDSRDMSETEWISTMLTKIKVFAMSYGIHIFFVAHPTKMQRSVDGRIPPPGGFDVAGSAAWFAKADCGITIHREKEEPNITQFHVWKCRFAWIGKQGQTNLFYDAATMRYYEAREEDYQEFKL